MSTRQMRRLRKQQEELQILQNTEEDLSDDEGDDEPTPPKPRGNVFAGFAALADDGGDDDDENEDDDAGEDHATESTSNPPVADASSAPKKSKKSKKKKAKQAKKGEASAAPDAASEKVDAVDEIDKALEELKLAQAQEQPQPSGQWITPGSAYDAQKLSGLFQINFQHLKAMNEMRKVFGREAIDAAIAEDAAQEAAARAERLRQQRVDLETFLRVFPGKPMSDVVLKRNPFIDGKKSWPNDSTAGLTMKAISNANDAIVEYAIVHERSYDELEREFFYLVQTYDPMNIVHFLHKHPYHISSLIQVSKVAKQDQNSALAAELCERALFTFGRVALSSFRKKLEQGQARLDFKRPENRQFYLAGYNYIRNLIRKGTYRTALEWTKLFLSLNTNDPYGLLNWLHVLAIRAHEGQWFVDLCDSELFDESRGAVTGLYIKQTLPLAKMQLRDRAGAKSTLIEGMEQLPWLYAALFSQLNLDIPKSIWGAQPREPSEELHTKLYIHMASDLWNNPQSTELLVEAAQAAQKVKDITSLPPSPPVSRNTARFIYLDDTPSMLSAVPRGMLDVSPNFDFDPLPPLREENIFSSDVQMLPWSNGSRPTRQLDVQEVLDLFGRHVDRHTDRAQGADGEGIDGEQARLGGLPPGVQAGLEAALQAINAQDGGGGPGGLLDFLNGLRARGLDANAPNNPAIPGDVEDFAQMPGAWTDEEEVEDEEDDDEMPPLEEAGNGRNWLRQLLAASFGRGTAPEAEGEEEMPPLIPVTDEERPQAVGNAGGPGPEAVRHARVEDAEDEGSDDE